MITIGEYKRITLYAGDDRLPVSILITGITNCQTRLKIARDLLMITILFPTVPLKDNLN